MRLLSAPYDAVNYLTLDVQTGSTDGNEQELPLKHLPKVERGDILLLDRGYPGTALFAGLQSGGIHFILRMWEHWLQVREFRVSRKRDTIVTLTLLDKYYDRFRQEFPKSPAYIYLYPCPSGSEAMEFDGHQRTAGHAH
ncbi:hypothetical protein Q4E93_20490 [Flavitalea sp. BT771]|nr:transposase [Flavitalea sp. BT771]MDO6432998.1 hypothetical protein [Flavitalea sp. BT771]MDV6221726.1 hypothetical protein [Flavitalea sp. BT771]